MENVYLRPSLFLTFLPSKVLGLLALTHNIHTPICIYLSRSHSSVDLTTSTRRGKFRRQGPTKEVSLINLVGIGWYCWLKLVASIKYFPCNKYILHLALACTSIHYEW